MTISARLQNRSSILQKGGGVELSLFDTVCRPALRDHWASYKNGSPSTGGFSQGVQPITHLWRDCRNISTPLNFITGLFLNENAQGSDEQIHLPTQEIFAITTGLPWQPERMKCEWRPTQNIRYCCRVLATTSSVISFNDEAYTKLNDYVIVNNKLESLWTGAVVSWGSIQEFTRRDWVKPRNIYVKTNGVTTEIRNGYPMNIRGLEL
jgi:hypothetical protein